MDVDNEGTDSLLSGRESDPPSAHPGGREFTRPAPSRAPGGGKRPASQNTSRRKRGGAPVGAGVLAGRAPRGRAGAAGATGGA